MRFLFCGATTLQSAFNTDLSVGEFHPTVASTLRPGGLAAVGAETVVNLGHEAHVLTSLGDTPAAEMVRSHLLAAGVDVEDLAGEGSPGLSTVIGGLTPTVLSDGEDVRPTAMPTPAVLDGVSALIIDTSLPNVQIPLARQAKQAGIPVICHLESDSAEAKMMVPVTTHVVCSQRYGAGRDVTEVCSEVFYWGTSFVAKTRGADSIIIAADEQAYEMPVPPIENIVDTYGASLVLTAGLAVGIAEQKDPLEALVAGAQLAAVSITYPGPLGWATELSD